MHSSLVHEGTCFLAFMKPSSIKDEAYLLYSLRILSFQLLVKVTKECDEHRGVSICICASIIDSTKGVNCSY